MEKPKPAIKPGFLLKKKAPTPLGEEFGKNTLINFEPEHTIREFNKNTRKRVGVNTKAPTLQNRQNYSEFMSKIKAGEKNTNEARASVMAKVAVKARNKARMIAQQEATRKEAKRIAAQQKAALLLQEEKEREEAEQKAAEQKAAEQKATELKQKKNEEETRLKEIRQQWKPYWTPETELYWAPGAELYANPQGLYSTNFGAAYQNTLAKPLVLKNSAQQQEKIDLETAKKEATKMLFKPEGAKFREAQEKATLNEAVREDAEKAKSILKQLKENDLNSKTKEALKKLADLVIEDTQFMRLVKRFEKTKQKIQYLQNPYSLTGATSYSIYNTNKNTNEINLKTEKDKNELEDKLAKMKGELIDKKNKTTNDYKKLNEDIRKYTIIFEDLVKEIQENDRFRKLTNPNVRPKDLTDFNLQVEKEREIETLQKKLDRLISLIKETKEYKDQEEYLTEVVNNNTSNDENNTEMALNPQIIEQKLAERQADAKARLSILQFILKMGKLLALHYLEIPNPSGFLYEIDLLTPWGASDIDKQKQKRLNWLATQNTTIYCDKDGKCGLRNSPFSNFKFKYKPEYAQSTFTNNFKKIYKSAVAKYKNAKKTLKNVKNTFKAPTLGPNNLPVVQEAKYYYPQGCPPGIEGSCISDIPGPTPGTVLGTKQGNPTVFNRPTNPMTWGNSRGTYTKEGSKVYYTDWAAPPWEKPFTYQVANETPWGKNANWSNPYSSYYIQDPSTASTSATSWESTWPSKYSIGVHDTYQNTSGTPFNYSTMWNAYSKTRKNNSSKNSKK